MAKSFNSSMKALPVIPVISPVVPILMYMIVKSGDWFDNYSTRLESRGGDDESNIEPT